MVERPLDPATNTSQAPVEDGPATLAEPEIISLAGRLFEHIEGQIGRADLKAQLTLTADALLIAVIVTLDRGTATVLADGAANIIARLVALYTLSMLAALTVSFFYGLLVVWPATTSPKRKAALYFRSIANRPEIDFIKDFARQTMAEAQEELIAEVHAKAVIARSKYDHLRSSVAFLVAALVSWTLVEILLAFMS